MDEETTKQFKELIGNFIKINNALALQLIKTNPCNPDALHELRENIIALNTINGR